jgi:hypothetical protein
MALMQTAFGSAIVGAEIFAAREMPHGATLLGGESILSFTRRTLSAPPSSWSMKHLPVDRRARSFR